MTHIHLEFPLGVLLDIGDTVLEERRFDLEAGIAAAAGPRDAAALADQFREELAERHRLGGELLLARWLREQVPSLADTPVSAIERSVWDAVVTLVPRPGVADALERLCDDNVRVGAVSNASFSGHMLSDELERHGLRRRFRFVLTSADVDVRKPAEAIFEIALARLETDARQTWFMGDSLDEDIDGASAAGLQPIWFSSGAVNSSAASVATVRSWVNFMQLYDSVRAKPSHGAPP